MKNAFFAAVAPILLATSSLAWSYSEQPLDHNPGASIATLAYNLADTGEYMANYARWSDRSLYYGASDVHMAASDLYHAVNNRNRLSMQENSDSTFGSEEPQDHTDGELRPYWYRIQRAFNSLWRTYYNCNTDARMDRYFAEVEESYDDLSVYF